MNKYHFICLAVCYSQMHGRTVILKLIKPSLSMIFIIDKSLLSSAHFAIFFTRSRDSILCSFLSFLNVFFLHKKHVYMRDVGKSSFVEAISTRKDSVFEKVIQEFTCLENVYSTDVKIVYHPSCFRSY
jgi:hypothetical protein